MLSRWREIGIWMFSLQKKSLDVSPCCGRRYPCRMCHDQVEDHKINRFAVREMYCMACDTLQEISQTCSTCNTSHHYFCGVCKFLDDDDTKEIYHCNQCGFCRIGPKEKNYHCNECGACFPITNQHQKHVDQRFHSECPVCREMMHTSTRSSFMPDPCGHAIHVHCANGILKNDFIPKCPICSKTYDMIDKEQLWNYLRLEVVSMPMPFEYRAWTCNVLCSDCEIYSTVPFHIIGHECGNCRGFNTKVIETNKIENVAEENDLMVD